MKPGTRVYVSNESEEAALKEKLVGVWLWSISGGADSLHQVYVPKINAFAIVKNAVPIPIDREAVKAEFKEWAFANDLMMEDQKTRFWAFEAWLAAKENEG